MEPPKTIENFVSGKIRSELMNAVRTKNLYNKEKLKNLHLLSVIKRINKIVDVSNLIDPVKCELCKKYVPSERGLIIHKAKMHKH